MIDHYETLGITENASEKEIKEAFRKLASETHPDKEGGNTEKFQKINDAYQTLKDKKLKEDYDNQRKYGETNHFRFNSRSTGFNVDIEELMRQAGFQTGHRHHNPKNTDWTIQVVIDLIDAFNGKEQELTFTRPTGENQTIKLTIPKGIETGSRIKFSGLGDTSIKNIPAGDLYVQLIVNNNKDFIRESINLIKKLEIDMFESILGTKKIINTIDSKEISLNIPEMTKHGDLLRMQGLGMPHSGNETKRGDLYVQIYVVQPTNISDEQKELLKEIQKLREGK